eukprot:4239258-Amphidinium_carterae.1
MSDLPTQDLDSMKNKFDVLADYVMNIVYKMTLQFRIFPAGGGQESKVFPRSVSPSQLHCTE